MNAEQERLLEQFNELLEQDSPEEVMRMYAIDEIESGAMDSEKSSEGFLEAKKLLKRVLKRYADSIALPSRRRARA